MKEKKMKLTSNTKILRKLLILCVLTVGLVFVASDNATPVSAKSCFDATNDFFNSMDTYDTSFGLYYYNNPTSCDEDCSRFPPNSQERQNCVNECMIDRQTGLGNANIGILQASAGLNTCTNPPPNYCVNAQARAGDCLARYNYQQYPDLEQRLEISAVYWECRNASGIDTCQ